MAAAAGFEQRRAAALRALYGESWERVDRSRKGCVDAPVEALCGAVNSSREYYTTSSCSGRLALFQEPRRCAGGAGEGAGEVGDDDDGGMGGGGAGGAVDGDGDGGGGGGLGGSVGDGDAGAGDCASDQLRLHADGAAGGGVSSPGGNGDDSSAEQSQQGGYDPRRKRGGGEWLYLEHGLADADALVAAAARHDAHPAAGPLTLRFEPFILAVECRGREAAERVVAAAVGAGLRESGVMASGHRCVASVRCSVRLEVPVALNGVMLVDEAYLRTLTDVSNQKMHDNWARIERFTKAFDKLPGAAPFVGACADGGAQGEPLPPPPSAIAVPKRAAKVWKDALKAAGLLDRKRKAATGEAEVLLPLVAQAAAGVISHAARGAGKAWYQAPKVTAFDHGSTRVTRDLTLADCNFMPENPRAQVSHCYFMLLR